MKVVRVEDVQKLFDKSNNLITAYDFDCLETFELPSNEYKVELTYTVTVQGYSEDDAIEAAEKLIADKKIPYDLSCVTKY